MQRFVRPEDVDAKLAYKADHNSEEVRVDVGLVVESCGCCNKMSTCSVDPKHPQKCVGPQSYLGRCPKTKCLKVSLAVSSLNNIANVDPKGAYFLWSQNALAPVSSHTSILCQHSPTCSVNPTHLILVRFDTKVSIFND